MDITVTSHKGGVGKTITAVHLAAYLMLEFGEGSTLLVDGDPNRSALEWGSRGNLPFPVVSQYQAPKYLRDHEHVVIDTQGRPNRQDLEELVEGCDLLVIPTTPDALALQALMLTVEDLEGLGRADGYKVLLADVPPWPVRSGKKARRELDAIGVSLFEAEIRRREAFQKAANEGVPVYDLRERGARQGWEDYESVGREVVAAL
jgi:chromosome partitioning protein